MVLIWPSKDSLSAGAAALFALQPNELKKAGSFLILKFEIQTRALY